MRSIGLVISAVLVVTAPLVAQDPQVRRERLRQQVVLRFVRNFRAQAGLTDEQFQRFQEVLRGSFEAHAQLQRRERTLWMALEGEMRPGVAADRDSVVALLDALTELAVERAERLVTDQQTLAEFLNPVQRAQFTLFWRRLQQQIERLRRDELPGRQPGG